MVIIDEILVSDDLLNHFFCCDLEECQGLCCIEGDTGAPLEVEEISELEDHFPLFRKYMTAEGIDLVEKNGTFDYDMEGAFVTPLLANEACAFAYFENGIAKCAIEKAFFQKEIDFQKPISCHLYPIRVKKLSHCEALNYHRWGVCEPACAKGKEKSVQLYKFLKEPLIRKYGEIWYQKFCSVAEKMMSNRL